MGIHQCEQMFACGMMYTKYSGFCEVLYGLSHASADYLLSTCMCSLWHNLNSET